MSCGMGGVICNGVSGGMDGGMAGSFYDAIGSGMVGGMGGDMSASYGMGNGACGSSCYGGYGGGGSCGSASSGGYNDYFVEGRTYSGVCKNYNSKSGYGFFIVDAGGCSRDLFFSVRDVPEELNLLDLAGQSFTFEIGRGNDGRQQARRIRTGSLSGLGAGCGFEGGGGGNFSGGGGGCGRVRLRGWRWRQFF